MTRDPWFFTGPNILHSFSCNWRQLKVSYLLGPSSELGQDQRTTAARNDERGRQTPSNSRTHKKLATWWTHAPNIWSRHSRTHIQELLWRRTPAATNACSFLYFSRRTECNRVHGYLCLTHARAHVEHMHMGHYLMHMHHTTSTRSIGTGPPRWQPHLPNSFSSTN